MIFVNASCSIKNDRIIFDIYHKPTHSFSYLLYRRCHPQHTKSNTVLSLGQRIIRIVSENKEQYLNKLKSCVIQCGHPEEVLDYTMIKLFSPSFKDQNESTDYITFVQPYNPNTKFNKNIINNILNDFHDNLLKKAFRKKKPLLATRQAKSLQNLVIRARIDAVPKRIAPPKNITTIKVPFTLPQLY